MSAQIIRLVVDNRKPSEIDEARQRCQRLTHVDRDPATRSGQRLVAPGCAIGCATCFRACAVNRIKLRFWVQELERLSGDSA